MTDTANFFVTFVVIGGAAWYITAEAIATHRNDRYRIAAFRHWGPTASIPAILMFSATNMLANYLAPERVTTTIGDVIIYGALFPALAVYYGLNYRQNRATWRQERAIRRGELVRFTDDGTVFILTPASAADYQALKDEQAAKRRESARRAWEADRRRRDLHNKLTIPVIPKD